MKERILQLVLHLIWFSFFTYGVIIGGAIILEGSFYIKKVGVMFILLFIGSLAHHIWRKRVMTKEEFCKLWKEIGFELTEESKKIIGNWQGITMISRFPSLYFSIFKLDTNERVELFSVVKKPFQMDNIYLVKSEGQINSFEIDHPLIKELVLRLLQQIDSITVSLSLNNNVLKTTIHGTPELKNNFYKNIRNSIWFFKELSQELQRIN